MNAENLSTEALLAELKKRKVEEAMSIDEKIAEMTPKPILSDPNLAGLISICTDYVQDEVEKGWVDEDLSHYIFEEAMTTIMGKDVFDRLRAIEKLKKQKTN